MKLNKIKKDLNLKILCAEKFLDTEVKGGYTSDLLSDVMANSKEKYIWITLQIHLNIVAVAKLKELSGIIIVNGRKPDSDTLKKAEQENCPILTTPKTAFEISGELYQLLRGK
ncbi:MAG TPA: DRTGG domain-containing protein [Acidobacteriota bacterium]|nr:DRTGG domain-containing protein [Acidobacteriota bacterium]